MTSPELRRVAVVRAEQRQSTGYLVAPGLVLTAAHCVGRIGTWAEVRVLRPGTLPGGLQASAAARFRVIALSDGFRGTGVDGFALLGAEKEDPFRLGRTPPVRWGRLTGDEPLTAQAYAFPVLAVEDHRQNLEHAWGRLIPGSGTVTGPSRPGWYHVFQVTSGSFAGERWHGASGAAVFSEGRLLGLLGACVPEERGRLKVIPVQLLSGQDTFLRALAEGGAEHVVFEPVWRGQQVLEHPYDPLPDDPSAADLLLPRYSVVDFCGREEELRELTEWCTAPAPHAVSVRLVTGDRSIGKTRLARELCGRMTGLGWVAGLLKPLEERVLRLMGLDEDLLVVVDDADAKVGQLDALLRHRGGGKQVRLLATARHEGHWWADFRRRYGDVAEEEPYRLRSPDAGERQDIYERACRAFLLRDARWHEGDGLPHASEDLSAPDFAGCLFVLILAMTDARRFLDPSWGLESAALSHAKTLYAQVLDLEREDWLKNAARAGLPADPVLLERVVAVSSMAFAGGTTAGEQESQAAERLRMVPDLRDASEEHRRRFVRYFQERIDGYGALRPLRPARLAQYLVANTVRAFPDLLSQALDVDPLHQPEVWARQALATLQVISPAAFADDAREPSDTTLREALRVAVEKHAPALVGLVRATQETPDGTTTRSLAAALETIFRNLPAGEFTAAAAQELEESCPDALQSLAIVLRRKAVEFYSAQEPLSHETQFRRATENRKLSRVLADAGRRGDARDRALLALQQFTVLTRTDDSYAYQLGKAHALSNAGVRHRETGRLTESLEAARESVRLYETLLHTHRDRSHHRYLSIAQCNLSDSLSDKGRWREALQAAADACALVSGELPPPPGPPRSRCAPGRYPRPRPSPGAFSPNARPTRPTRGSSSRRSPRPPAPGTSTGVCWTGTAAGGNATTPARWPSWGAATTSAVSGTTASGSSARRSRCTRTWSTSTGRPHARSTPRHCAIWRARISARPGNPAGTTLRRCWQKGRGGPREPTVITRTWPRRRRTPNARTTRAPWVCGPRWSWACAIHGEPATWPGRPWTSWTGMCRTRPGSTAVT
ncbi:hypothetical protein IAG44_01510 [Streptomyces roseirectus]|uniref:Serine protease n=1 Tax=Streptomyces roseirectus TaxID=2768066 RepID=A0A7H0I659_9ACTN|nr:hypothetical protein [Streptomyces roseirectus]QNP68275.1 hypothetical protein IAG44_01510 [Streptomyces roseirectus]